MELRALLGRNEWLAEEKRAYAGELAEAFEGLSEQFRLDRILLLALRIEDVILSYVVARWVEALLTLAERGPSDRKTSKRPVDPVLVAAGKARERRRKAMKELEDLCAPSRT